MSTPLHQAHKQMLRHLLGLNDDVVQHFDIGGPVQGANSSGGSAVGGFLSPLTGNNFSPVAPTIQPGTNVDQLNNAYNGAQSGIQDQSNLVNALAGQGGVQNESNIFNQEQRLADQQNAAEGVKKQEFAGQGFYDLATGNGPSVAQNQLNQTTGNNIANQAALAAGTRGVGANAGLLARQVAQQGANTQQQAVGQGATLRAQEVSNALSNLGNLGSTIVGQQQGTQNSLSGIAGNQINQLGQATTGLNTAQQNEQNILQNANNSTNNNLVGSQSNLNNINAGTSQANQSANNGLIGGILNGGGGAVLSQILAKGGEVSDSQKLLATALSKKKMPEHLKHMAKIYHPKMMADGGEADSDQDNKVDLGKADYTQPMAPTTINTGTSPTKSSSGGGGGGDSGLLGGAVGAIAALFDNGGKVPGEPEHPKTNTEKNDKVPALLTPKEIVLPLSVTQSPNPGEAAKQFVERIKGQDNGQAFKQALREHVKKRKSKR